jgi:hypothetical protein
VNDLRLPAACVATGRSRLSVAPPRHRIGGVNDEDIRARLAGLRLEHRDLDAAIEALAQSGSTDQLQVARLKKRKLALKDEIVAFENRLIPDIIA